MSPTLRPVTIRGGEVMSYHITLHSCRLRGSRDRDKIEAPLVRLEERGLESFAS
jgi:hypothetical protein